MAELVEKFSFAGALPQNIGNLMIEEGDAPLFTLAATAEQLGAVKAALKSAYGLDWPAPNRAKGRGDIRALWFDHAHILVQGVQAFTLPDVPCAITDQSDGWAQMILSGADACAVLSRLTPLDLRDGTFKVGHTARSELQHMQCSLTRLGRSKYQILVFRSMAQTLLHDVRTAAQSVAALKA